MIIELPVLEPARLKVRLLAKLGANLGATTTDGKTLASIAAEAGDAEMLRVLAALGANLDAATSYDADK